MITRRDVLAVAFPAADPDPEVAVYESVGDVFHALVYTDLFWPPCLTVHDAVVLGVGANSRRWVDDGIAALLARPDAERPAWPAIVDRFNWFEIPYLFRSHPCPPDWGDEGYYELADVLAQTWTARLAAQFPERTFRVAVNAPSGPYDPHALNLSVHQIDPPLGDAPTGEQGANGPSR